MTPAEISLTDIYNLQLQLYALTIVLFIGFAVIMGFKVK